MSMNVTQGSRTGSISTHNEGSRRSGNTTSGSRNESIFNAPRPGSGSRSGGAHKQGAANPFDGKSFNKYAYDHHFGEVGGKDYGHKHHHGHKREFTDSKFENNLHHEKQTKAKKAGGWIGGIVGFLAFGPLGAVAGALIGSSIGKHSVPSPHHHHHHHNR